MQATVRDGRKRPVPTISGGVTNWYLTNMKNESLFAGANENRATAIPETGGRFSLNRRMERIITEGEQRIGGDVDFHMVFDHMRHETQEAFADYFGTSGGLLNARGERLYQDIEEFFNDAELYIEDESNRYRLFDQLLTAVRDTLAHELQNEEVKIARLFSNEQSALRKFGENLSTGCFVLMQGSRFLYRRLILCYIN